MIHSALLAGTAEFPRVPQNPDVSPAPAVSRGRDGAAGTVAPDPASTPQTPTSTGDACMQQLPFLLAFVAIFYFFIIRPGQKQEKARRALLATVKKGDRVATNSGMHGTIQTLTDDRVTLRVDKDVKLVFDRSAIGRVLESEPSETKPD